ncbi:MAG: aldehyde ferredoxin oxidoreductase family protein [Desulfurococcales archaeon]|nr:aldehyde ferredoxin oxidoreductase family protein [Desulfurococcales archaeon]
MKGWNGKILWIDLSRKETKVVKYPQGWAKEYLGGRGLAVRLLWEYMPPGADPLGPDNLLIFAVGPLTGLTVPSSGKLVVAAKSPLTGGYGDGNIGSWASYHIRKAGYDAVVFQGASDKPVVVYVENDKVEFRDADDLWGLDTWETEKKLKEEYGKNLGILEIGPAGENQVLYATVMSQEGRSGGRPGIGAVMGSKKLKAFVVKGTKEILVHDPKQLRREGSKAYVEIVKSKMYSFWMRQGTMMTIDWAQEASVLPTYNFSEGVFDGYKGINGYRLEEMKIDQRGCPFCNMPCGNVVKDAEGMPSELDYENVAMLGSNIGLDDLAKVSVLNRLADKYGVDTISLGNTIGWAVEASQKGVLSEKLEWGDYERFKELIDEIVFKKSDLGKLLAKGTKRACEEAGGGCEYTMQVKGLEISAYDCHAAPGMALAFSTSSIGAHHKEAWVISWEVATDRFGYGREKAAKVIELQRLRGGLFESFVACRLPWVEVGLNLEYYPRLLKYATGVTFTWEELYDIADRIYALVRAFWIRELGDWSREMDKPPVKWFKQPLTKGPYAGAKLDKDKFEELLDHYYDLRGWDRRGVPKKETLEKLHLDFVIPVLESKVALR